MKNPPVENIQTDMEARVAGWMVIVMSLWYIVFGVLMIFLQIGWGKEMISLKAGFLNGKLGRAMFYMFCGSTAGGAAAAKDASALLVTFAYLNWGMCWFVGVLEMCGPREVKPGGVGLPHEPTRTDPCLSINITPSQAASAATWASNNAGTVAAVAGAATSAANNSEIQSDNPFFGIAQQRA